MGLISNAIGWLQGKKTNMLGITMLVHGLIMFTTGPLGIFINGGMTLVELLQNPLLAEIWGGPTIMAIRAAIAKSGGDSNTMRSFAVFALMGLLFSGMTCMPENMTVKEEDGSLVAGRECTTDSDGIVCCTSKVPFEGKIIEASKCYSSAEEVPTKPE